MDSHILYSTVIVMPLLVYLVAVAPAESCSRKEAWSCDHKLEPMINNSDLMEPTNDEDYFKACGILTQVLLCFNNFRDRCLYIMRPKERELFIQSLIESNQNIKDKCPHVPALKSTQHYVKPPCYAGEEFDRCDEETDKKTEPISAKDNITEEDYKKLCCYFNENKECRENVSIRKCGSKDNYVVEYKDEDLENAVEVCTKTGLNSDCISSAPASYTFNSYTSLSTMPYIFEGESPDAIEKSTSFHGSVSAMEGTTLNKQYYTEQPCDLAEDFDRCNEETLKKIQPYFSKGYFDSIPKEDKRTVCCILNENEECKKNVSNRKCSSITYDNYTEHKDEDIKIAEEVCTKAGLYPDCISSAPASCAFNSFMSLISCAASYFYLSHRYI